MISNIFKSSIVSLAIGIFVFSNNILYSMEEQNVLGEQNIQHFLGYQIDPKENINTSIDFVIDRSNFLINQMEEHNISKEMLYKDIKEEIQNKKREEKSEKKTQKRK